MKSLRVVLASTLGAIVVVAIVFAAGVANGHRADLCQLVGSSITGSMDAWSWTIGALVQLLIAVIAGIVYAGIFEWVTSRAGAAIGAVVALGHVVFAGLAVGFLPATRLIDASIAPPGAFMEYRGGLVVLAFVAAHVAFGAIVGALYGRPCHARAVPVVAWRDVSAER